MSLLLPFGGAGVQAPIPPAAAGELFELYFYDQERDLGSVIGGTLFGGPNQSDPTGTVTGGIIQTGPIQIAPTGTVAGGTVQSGPDQTSPTGTVTGGTILAPDQIL